MAAPLQPREIKYSMDPYTGIVSVYGRSEIGTVIRIVFPDGQISESASDANGFFIVQSTADVTASGYLRITARNADNESSRNINVEYIDSPTKPVIPIAIEQVETDNQTGQVTVQGSVTPNARVTVTFPDGQQGVVTADANGLYSVTSTNDVVGDGDIEVVAQQPNNTTDKLSVEYIDFIDTSTVTVPVLDAYTIDATGAIKVTGKADAGTTIKVYNDGDVISTAYTDANGHFSLTLPTDYNNGSILNITATNSSGRESDSAVFATNPIFAADNQSSVIVDNIQSLTATVNHQSKTFVKLINSPLLKFLGMGSIKGDFDFSVKQNHTQDLVATVKSLSVVALLDKTAIVLYKQQANGSWKPVANNKDIGLLDIIFFGEQATIKIKNLDTGNYKLGFESQPFAGVLNALTVDVSHIDYDLNQLPKTNTSVQSIKGNVLTDASADGQVDRLGDNEDITLSILKDGQYIDVVGSSVQVQGKYGVLTITADGSYIYQAAKQLSTNAQVEEFSYKITHANGDSSIATLTVDFNYNWKGTADDDVFVSTAANDTITSGKGSDTLIYKVLDNTSNNGGNGHDIWTDFDVVKSGGDKLDLSDLLVGYNGHASTLSQYISLSKEISANGKIDTVISIDRDGTAGKYQTEQLITLHDVNTDLLTLLNNGQIIA